MVALFFISFVLPSASRLLFRIPDPQPAHPLQEPSCLLNTPGLASAHKLSTALVILAPEPSLPRDLVPHFLYSFNNKQGFLIQSLQTPYPLISMFARRNIVFTCPQTLPDPRRGNGPLPAHFTFAPCK